LKIWQISFHFSSLIQAINQFAIAAVYYCVLLLNQIEDVQEKQWRKQIKFRDKEWRWKKGFNWRRMNAGRARGVRIYRVSFKTLLDLHKEYQHCFHWHFSVVKMVEIARFLSLIFIYQLSRKGIFLESWKRIGSTKWILG
jgi:hypothetical protein